MPQKPFHKVLSCKLSSPVKEWAKTYVRRFEWFDGYDPQDDQQSVRRFDVHGVVGLMALRHLGYDIGVDPKKYLNAGVDVAIDYFCGDWWKGDKDLEKRMDKSKKKRGLEWYEVFTDGLLLALLSQRWKDVEKLCDWVEADIVADANCADEDNEHEVESVYKSVAASLRKRPMPGIEKVESKARKSPLERTRLLFAAWDAAKQKDQPAFEEAIVKSLKHYEKRYGKGRIARYWIAQHQSVVIMAARRLKLKQPELPEELRARIICPETIA